MNEEDPERDRATQEQEEEECIANTVRGWTARESRSLGALGKFLYLHVVTCCVTTTAHLNR